MLTWASLTSVFLYQGVVYYAAKSPPLNPAIAQRRVQSSLEDRRWSKGEIPGKKLSELNYSQWSELAQASRSFLSHARIFSTRILPAPLSWVHWFQNSTPKALNGQISSTHLDWVVLGRRKKSAPRGTKFTSLSSTSLPHWPSPPHTCLVPKKPNQIHWDMPTFSFLSSRVTQQVFFPSQFLLKPLFCLPQPWAFCFAELLWIKSFSLTF